ncbi:MAG: hypothetical protein RLZZ122_1, partial [Actinomycetota bacterium]
PFKPSGTMSNLGALMAAYLVSQKNTNYRQAYSNNQKDVRHIHNWKLEWNLDEDHNTPI